MILWYFGSFYLVYPHCMKGWKLAFLYIYKAVCFVYYLEYLPSNQFDLL